MNIADVAQHVHALERQVKEQTNEIERLREALNKIVELDGYAADGYEYHKLAIKSARAALKEGE